MVGQQILNLLGCFRLYIRLKKAIIYHIDLSSHSLKLVHHVLDIDMFSIDSAYDLKFEDFAIDEFDERMDLYCCLKKRRRRYYCNESLLWRKTLIRR